jgi:hypothetical protein
VEKDHLSVQGGDRSERIGSKYIRILQDIMAFGKAVTIQLFSTKFFCDNSTCSKNIFTERFESLIRASSKRTE